MPCTLGVGYDLWLYDTDGLPSNSESLFLAVAPCFTIPVGSSMSAALDYPKVITILRGDGIVIQTAPFEAYDLVFADAGLRQVATVDGSAYWLAGIASEEWGFRYLVAGNNYTTLVSSSDASLPGKPIVDNCDGFCCDCGLHALCRVARCLCHV